VRRYAAHEVGDKTVTSVKIVEADGKTGQDINRGEGIKTDHIQNEAVVEPKIKNDAVSSAKIKKADDETGQDTSKGYGIKTAHIQNLAVETDKIDNAAVTEPKLGVDSVTSAKIRNGNVGTDELADGAVTEVKLGVNSVTSSKIKDGNVGTAELANGAVTEAKLGSDSVTSSKIKNSNVGTAEIANGAVTVVKLGANSVTSAKIMNDNVGTDKLANGAVTESKLGDNSVTSAKIKDGSVGNAEIANGAVTESKLGANSVTSAKIKDGSVGNAELANDSVTYEKLDTTTRGKLVTGGNSHNHSGPPPSGDGTEKINHSDLNLDGGTNPHNIKMSDLDNFDAGQNIITNLKKEPIKETDAATKWYVDDVTSGKLVTNGNTHDHTGGDGGTIKHRDLDLGNNTNPHGTTASDVGAATIGYVSGIINSLHGDSQVNASMESTASRKYSQINASSKSKIEGVDIYSNPIKYAQINASYDSTASGNRSQVNASDLSTASGLVCSQVNASYNSTASGSNSQVNASKGSIANKECSQVCASSGVESPDSYMVCGGYGGGVTPSTTNITWAIDSELGNISCKYINMNVPTFKDYGEYFENLRKGEIDVGLLVALEGDKVRSAKKDEEFIGVVSGTAAIRLGDSSFCWQGRYLKDEWGRNVYKEIKDPDWEPKTVPDEKWKPKKGETEEDRPMIPIETEEDRPTIRVQKENPDYDPKREQIPRSERPEEWTLVGLLGQVYVRCDETVKPGDFVKSKDKGIGTKSEEKTRLRAMKVTKEYDGKYSIVYCLLI
jgi:hypothetical protein